MLNKYLLIAIAVLFGGCVLFYNLWDSTKIELNNVKAQKITLEQELKRRDENEKTCQNGFLNLLNYISFILTILILLCLISFLSSCTSPAKLVNRPPITCMEHIKTNADLVNCLVEYDEKY